jgi:hypothetical protein
MSKKHDETTRDNNIEQALLEELFPTSDSNQLIDIDEPSLVAIGQLISYSSVLGGLVTFYGRAGDNGLGISVRIGKRKRGFVFDGDDISYQELVRFTDGFKRLYLHRLDGPEAPKAAHKPLKGQRHKE